MAIETTGVFGPRTADFLKELGHQLRQVSGEDNSFAYLTQRLSVAVQRGNAASMLGIIKVDSEDKGFCTSSFMFCLCHEIMHINCVMYLTVTLFSPCCLLLPQ